MVAARSYDIGRWGRPPLPFQSHRYRWHLFSRTVVQRIEALREQEGIDGRLTPWQAFDRPLPATAPLPFPPVRLRLMAAPTLPRDPRTGRLLARGEAAS